jgi:hypothetical protein
MVSTSGSGASSPGRRRHRHERRKVDPHAAVEPARRISRPLRRAGASTVRRREARATHRSPLTGRMAQRPTSASRMRPDRKRQTARSACPAARDGQVGDASVDEAGGCSPPIGCSRRLSASRDSSAV